MTKALLIDLDGVPRIWDGAHDREVERSSGLPPGALLAAAFAPELLLPAITGAISDEAWRLEVGRRPFTHLRIDTFLRRTAPGQRGWRLVS